MREWKNFHRQFHHDSRQSSDRRRGGFTLTELIVVITVLLILGGGIVIGVSAWMNHTAFQQQEEYAQTLYMAAQNQLSEYSGSGRLEPQVQTPMTDSRGGYKNVMKFSDLKLIDSAGTVITDDMVWPARQGKAAAEVGKYTGEVCYLMGTSELYAKYQEYKKTNSMPAGLTSEICLLYELLAPYLYDESILDAAICMEFSPDNGQVYSVFYSSAAQNYTYAETDDTRGTVSIKSRERSSCKARMVGYYGVDTLSQATTTKAQRPSIVDVKLNNEETLNLSFRFNKIKEAINQLTYTIIVYDADTSKKRMEITFDGTVLESVDQEGTKAVECDVLRFAENGIDKLDEQSPGSGVYGRKYPLLVQQQTDNTIRIVFDAADLSATQHIYSYKSSGMAQSVQQQLQTSAPLPISGDVREYANAYSFTRFGLEAEVENIYCTVQASGSVYKPTAKKQSNTGCVYFSRTQKQETDTDEYTYTYDIANARHLYNVRYQELARTTTAAKVKNIYQLTQNISWEQFITRGGLYDSANLYQNKTGLDAGNNAKLYAVTQAENIVFPSIRSLGALSTFKSKGERPNTITGLRISEAGNVASSVYGIKVVSGVNEKVKEGATGLFVTNAGSIETVALDQIRVSGTEQVGAFCGTNTGNLQKAKVLNSQATDADKSSRITGKTNVGGLIGSIEAKGETPATYTYSNLENYAQVVGTENVGGILGALTLVKETDAAGVIKETKETHVLNGCLNYGVVEATSVKEIYQTKNPTVASPKEEDLLAVRNEARNIGGIVGLADNQTDNMSLLQLQGCNSAPQYSNLASMLPQADDTDVVRAQKVSALAKKLNGRNVGGIVGYSKNSQIQGCSTENKLGGAAYVFGYQYVGGIAGTLEGEAVLDGNRAAEGEQAVRGINALHVIGAQYVGGITGANTATVQNWMNKGVVLAAENYAGGITGINGMNPAPDPDETADDPEAAEKRAQKAAEINKTATLWNCTSQIVPDSLAKQFAALPELKGNCIGGIAGGNHATITAGTKLDDTENMIEVTGYASGNNYVGGIVGYNAAGASVHNYHLAGGSISGEIYVGGFAGLNASEELLKDASVESNPNTVEGMYCVGGIIGANLVAPTEKTVEGTNTLAPLGVKLRTNNFLGNIKARAFAGGFIGYNCLLKDVKDIPVLREKLLSAFEGIKEITIDPQTSLDKGINEPFAGDVAVIMDPTSGLKPSASGVTLEISGTQQGSAGQSRLGGLEAEIYVGGLIGYNTDSSRLYIKNVNNQTPVKATKAVKNETENKGGLLYLRNELGMTNDEEYTYSYVGGIIGKVSEHTTIDNCSNTDEGDIESVGTFLGGICEVNEGMIINCTVPSVGSRLKDYVGGIAGLNKGTIQDCQFVLGQIVTGKDVVGGIAAENMGTINIDTKDFQLAVVNASGSFVGGIVGYNGKEMNLQINASAEQASVTVSADGDCVGGVAGANHGMVDVETTEETSEFALSGSVSGWNYVGGIVGYNTTSSEMVTEKETYTLGNLVNRTLVIASQGEAGGIAGYSSTTILNCKNEKEVRAEGIGNAGGIVAENTATISECVSTASVSAANGQCGGIASTNTGTIRGCEVKGTENSHIIIEGMDFVGGICGSNRTSDLPGVIRENTNVEYVTVQNNGKIDESMIGGVCGSNAGLIGYLEANKTQETQEPQAAVTVESCAVRTRTNNSAAGGVAGENTGVIWSVSVSGPVNEEGKPKQPIVAFGNNGATVATFGGVCGINRESVADCEVKADILGAMGTKSTAYGGIVGINQSDAVVWSCNYSGNLKANGSADNVVRMGGIAGVNEACGSIKDSCVGTQANSQIASGYENGMQAYGYVGGVCGVNYGSVLGCDNAEKSSHAVAITNYAGNVGGIIGHQMSGAVVTGVQDSPVSTGKQWSVMAKYYSNDAGCGGIIGYSASGENISWVRNHAAVKSEAAKNNVAVGGLIGRLENRGEAAMLIDHFENYGSVTGVLAGGAIGRVKYRCPSFAECVNYGYIKQGSISSILAGLVATYYEANGTASFMSCRNHGTLETNYTAGGITGTINGSPALSFIDCVNTGCFIGGSSGGIAYAGRWDTYFYRCRNYGYSTTLNFSTIVHTGSYAAIQDCVNVGTPARLVFAEYNNKKLDTCFYLDEIKNSETNPKSQWVKSVQNGTKWNLQKEGENWISGLQYDPRDIQTFKSAKEAKAAYDPAITDAAEAFKKGLSPRQIVYLELDPKILDYYWTLSNTNPIADIKNLNMATEGRMMTFTWGHSNSQYYEDRISYTVTDASGNEVYKSKDEIIVPYGRQRYSVEIQPEWIGGKITFTVHAVNSSGTPGKELSIESLVYEALPIPQVHLELLPTPTESGKGRYVAVLENQQEYEKYECDIEITIKIDNETYYRSPINPKQSMYSGDITITNYEGGHTLETQAVAKNTTRYQSSLSIRTATMLIGSAKLKTTRYHTADFLDFYETLPESLYYQMTLNTGVANTDLYVNAELVVSDYQLPLSINGKTVKLDTVVSGGCSHVTQIGGAVTSILNNLPTDLTEYNKITVRSYPWQTQAYMVWFGHPVVEHISTETMQGYLDAVAAGQKDGTLKDTVRDEEVFQYSKEGKLSLKDGYVLYLNTDGTYSVFYSSILQYPDDYKQQINQKVYTIANGKMTSGVYERQIHPTPAISTEDTVLSEDGQSYTFRWDQGKNFSNAEYQLRLVGYTKEDTEKKNGVTLARTLINNTTPDEKEQPCFDASTKGWQYTFVDANNNWNYTTLKLEVTRVGTMDKYGKTTIFPSYAEKEFPIKLRFTQMIRPTVSLHKEGDTVDKDTLVYDVTFHPVPEAERGDVELYELRVQPPKTEDGEKAISLLMDQLAQEQAYYQARCEQYSGSVNEPAEAQDGEAKTVTYTWTEELPDGVSVTKQAILRYAEGAETFTERMEAVWTFPAKSLQEEESITKTVDLNDFRYSQTLQFSLRALAKDDTESDQSTYRDGLDGVVREITLPSRMQTPDVKKLTTDPEYQYDTENPEESAFMTLEEFADGIALKMTDSSATEQGRYELAAAIYDTAPTDEVRSDQSKRLTDDAPDNDSDGVPDETADAYWNAGARKTLITKASRTTMNGDLSEAVYQLVQGLDSEYAGKWLKVALRAVSENQISSWWTDEDETALGTINYAWLQIPRVQIEETGLVSETTDLYYTEENYSNTSFATDENVVTQTTLSFGPCTYADGYRLQRVRRADNEYSNTQELDGYSRYVVDWIYLEQPDVTNLGMPESYRVYCASSETGFNENWMKVLQIEEAPASPATCMQNPNAVYVGTLSKPQEGSESVLWLPFTETAAASESEDVPLTTRAALLWPQADGEDDAPIRFVLPDAESIRLGGSEEQYIDAEKNFFTMQTSVQAVILEEKKAARYESSRIANWYRENPSQNVWTSTIKEIEKTHAPSAIPQGIEAVNYSDISFVQRTSQQHWTVYEVEILDCTTLKQAESETVPVLDHRYISAYGRGGGDQSIDTVLALADAPYRDYAEKYVRLRTAHIISGDGVGTWSDPVITTLPELVKPPVTVTHIPVDAAAENAPVAQLRMHAARSLLQENNYIGGTTHTWTFDPKTDHKLNGYTLDLTNRVTDETSGQTAESAVQLQLVHTADDGWQIEEADKSTPLTEDAPYTCMAVESMSEALPTADETSQETAQTRTYWLSYTVAIAMKKEEDGRVTFSVTMPEEYPHVVRQEGTTPEGEPDLEELTFAFGSFEIEVNGWSVKPDIKK